jgi:hypothetical protein
MITIGKIKGVASDVIFRHVKLDDVNLRYIIYFAAICDQTPDMLIVTDRLAPPA